MIQKFIIRMVERLEKQEKKKISLSKEQPQETSSTPNPCCRDSGVRSGHSQAGLVGCCQATLPPTPPPPPCSRCCFRGCLIAAAASPSPNWRPRWEESHFSPLLCLQDPSEAACNGKPGDKRPGESRVGRILAPNHPELCTEQQLS